MTARTRAGKRAESVYLAVSTRLATDAQRNPSTAFICTVAAVPVLTVFVLLGIAGADDWRVNW